MSTRGWIVLAAAVTMLFGCGDGSLEQTTTATGPRPTAEPQTRPVLTPLAIKAAEQLRSQLEAEGRVNELDWLGDGETWWVTMAIEVPLEAADLDDPLAVLPAPLDALAPVVTQVVVESESPLGHQQVVMDTPVVGLRALLDGSRQPVTTVPGDEPPITSTWQITGARLTSIAAPVADVDRLPEIESLIETIGPEQLALGPPRGGGFLTVAEAESGVPATAPPLTGTVNTLPPPADDTTD